MRQTDHRTADIQRFSSPLSRQLASCRNRRFASSFNCMNICGASKC
jgi:hypothetical protein